LAVQPDAIFASNDMMAIGCMAALSAAGVRVPEDIAVVGFDDIPMARYLTPALTSVRVPIAALGANALNALVDIVEMPAIDVAHPNKPQPMIAMPVELVVRQSCGAKPPPL
jgi:LacI family transcriptional regulator